MRVVPLEGVEGGATATVAFDWTLAESLVQSLRLSRELVNVGRRASAQISIVFQQTLFLSLNINIVQSVQYQWISFNSDSSAQRGKWQ